MKNDFLNVHVYDLRLLNLSYPDLFPSSLFFLFFFGVCFLFLFFFFFLFNPAEISLIRELRHVAISEFEWKMLKR